MMTNVLLNSKNDQIFNHQTSSSILIDDLLTEPQENDAAQRVQLLEGNNLELALDLINNIQVPALNYIDLKKEFQYPRDYCLLYVCLNRICNCEFKHKQEFIEHSAIEHNVKYDNSSKNEIKSYYKCERCFKKFDDFNQLMKHMCALHLDRITGKLNICSQKNCFLLFQNEKDLKKHKEKTHRSVKIHTCELCNATFHYPTQLKIHLKKHENPKIQCEFCSEKFLKQSSLVKHVSDLHKDDPKQLKCPHSGCDKTFHCEINIRRHLKDCHANIKYQCSQCDKSFPKKWYRDQHEKIVHSTEKQFKFKCNFPDCNKSFPTSHKLTRHSLTHSENKIYKCTYDDCGDTFKRKDHLQSHLKAKHVSKPSFQCDFLDCNHVFKNEKKLLIHKEKEHFSETNMQPLAQIDDLNPCVAENVEHLALIASEVDTSNVILPNINEISTTAAASASNITTNSAMHLLKSISTDSIYSNSSNDSIYNDIRVLDKYGLIDLSNKIDNNGNIYVTQTHNSKPTKHKHVINMNSDDEEYAPTCVVVENLSGCARTDYKFNHTSMERNKWRKNKEGALMNIRSFNSFQTINEEFNNLNNTDLDFFDIQDKDFELPTIDTLLDNKQQNNVVTANEQNMMINGDNNYSVISFNDTQQLLQDVPELLVPF